MKLNIDTGNLGRQLEAELRRYEQTATEMAARKGRIDDLWEYRYMPDMIYGDSSSSSATATVKSVTASMKPMKPQKTRAQVKAFLDPLGLGELFFYGSRVMSGNWVEDSDWDVAVQHSERVIEILTENGFLPQYLSYSSNDTFHTFIKDFDGTLVQVSLREDLPRFKAVWRSIPLSFYSRFINKRSKQFMGREQCVQYFNSLNDVYKEGFNQAKEIYEGMWV
jgi:hypothetical protein